MIFLNFLFFVFHCCWVSWRICLCGVVLSICLMWCCLGYLLDVSVFVMLFWSCWYISLKLWHSDLDPRLLVHTIFWSGWGQGMQWLCELAEILTVTESWLLTFVTCSCFLDPCHMAISRDLDSTWTCCLCLPWEFVEEFIGGASFLTVYRMLASAAANSL